MVDDRSDAARLVRIDDLRRCLAGAFQRLRLAADDAEGLAGLLVDSELRGHPDHGVAALAVLVPGYRDGTLNPRPRVRALRETDGALLLDGDGGCGPGAPTRAMRWCIERARERSGMAVAAIRAWQIVVGAPYARLAAEAGLIGFVCTNFIPLVAPPGGRTAVLGSNPLAFGLPARRHDPVVLDVATSAASMQKVRIAAQEGTPIPEGSSSIATGVRPPIRERSSREGSWRRSAARRRRTRALGWPVRRCRDRCAERGRVRGRRGRRPNRELFLGPRRRGLPAAGGVPGAHGRADRPDHAGRSGSPGSTSWSSPASVASAATWKLTASGVVPLAPAGWQVLVASCDAGRAVARRPRRLIGRGPARRSGTQARTWRCPA